MPGRAWRWEMAATGILLPALVQILLAWRYDAFDLPAALVIATGVIGSFGSFLLGWKAIRRLTDLRRFVWETKPDRIEWTDSRMTGL